MLPSTAIGWVVSPLGVRTALHGCTQSLSHLYKTDGSMVGAFLRIDIPTLREFDQYNYVLFTGEAGPCSVASQCDHHQCSAVHMLDRRTVYGSFV